MCRLHVDHAYRCAERKNCFRHLFPAHPEAVTHLRAVWLPLNVATLDGNSFVHTLTSHFVPARHACTCVRACDLAFPP